MDDKYEVYENARNRIKQKKRLYFHFVFFLIGSVFFIVLNKVLKIGETLFENWFVWAIFLWLFFLIIHFINVFITHRFMGKEWERKQLDKLVLKQEEKIAQLEKKITSEEQNNTKDLLNTPKFKKKEYPNNNSIKE
ncbi:2TM domain-containing protein [Lutibacter sp.]